MRCPPHPCTEVAGDTYNFTKDSELIHQGRYLSKTITDINDAAVYCCIPHCANNTEPCCLNVGGTYIYYYVYVSIASHKCLVTVSLGMCHACKTVFFPYSSVKHNISHE